MQETTCTAINPVRIIAGSAVDEVSQPIPVNLPSDAVENAAKNASQAANRQLK
jgi:hypothetical protein